MSYADDRFDAEVGADDLAALLGENEPPPTTTYTTEVCPLHAVVWTRLTADLMAQCPQCLEDALPYCLECGARRGRPHWQGCPP